MCSTGEAGKLSYKAMSHILLREHLDKSVNGNISFFWSQYVDLYPGLSEERLHVFARGLFKS